VSDPTRTIRGPSADTPVSQVTLHSLRQLPRPVQVPGRRLQPLQSDSPCDPRKPLPNKRATTTRHPFVIVHRLPCGVVDLLSQESPPGLPPES
jgi:hypothetical protein